MAEARSCYYRRKFCEYGIDIRKARSPQDLGDFYLTPDDLRASPETLLCGRPDLAIESSGTTGHATRIFLSHQELEYSAKQSAVMKAVYGISAGDRILSTFDYGFCLDGQIIQRALPFNVVMSGTPWLSRFTDVAQAEGRPFPLKLLLGGGGGGITRRTRSKIEDFWEAPLCMTYGSAEAATVLGFECLHRDGYHLNEFDFYIEIVNPDLDGYGEVVFTTVNRKVMPLIRYRTRDIARVINEICRCGLPLRRLSPLRGRSDEIVASVWGNVHPDFFEGILDSIPAVSDDWQVALKEKDGKQSFEFRLELENGASRHDEIQSQIFTAIQKNHALAWQGYLQGLAGIEFVFLPRGSLRKGRKLLRLVDERHVVNRQ
ncbi:MAG: phenylacetate--CoA ligase family protein [Deltaproteobacteria bacterium]|nr:phenylacetate--CoA ligase family protein [Deltaproteobacteria bacterium]